MTKKTLLLAVSAAALAVGGTNAIASEISGTGTFSGVRSTGTSTAFVLANELRFFSSVTSSATATQGNLTFQFRSTGAGGFTNGESLLLTLNVQGAVFSTASASPITAYGTATASTASCTVAVSAATGVAAGASSATYFVTLTNCDNTATGMQITLPIQVTGANSVTASAGLQSSFGGQLFAVDGGAATATFITMGDAFQASFATTTPVTANVAASGGAYRDFTTSSPASVGSATITVNSAVNVDLSGTNPADFSDIETARITVAPVSGGFVGYTFTASAGTATVTATVTATSTSFEVDPIVNSTTVAFSVADVTGTASVAIPATTANFSLDVDLAADNNFGTSTGTFVDFSTSSSNAVLVNRNGTNFIAPWIALGSTTANSTIRLANNGSQATGPITVTLLSDNGTASPTTSSVVITSAQVSAGALNAQGGIDAGDVVSISGAALRTAFGTTAANGDVQVSVEASSSTISGKVRVTQSTGQIFETSLGNLTSGS